MQFCILFGMLIQNVIVSFRGGRYEQNHPDMSNFISW